MFYAFLAASLVPAFLIFKIGLDEDWHWSAALSVALIPIAFTFFFEFIGLLIGLSLLAAIWKAVG